MLKLTMTPLCKHELTYDEDLKKCGDEEIADRITVMRNNEANNYACTDYLLSTRESQRENNENNNRGNSLELDEFCREQICEWTFRVVDYFDINREVVIISMSFLDRFLSFYYCDRITYKLAATASLFLAVKLFEPKKIESMSILAHLSRGEFTMKDVIKMEHEFLNALTWKLNPPTSPCFISYLLCLLPENVGSNVKRSISGLANFFVELSVCDYFFVAIRPSLVALGAILNSMEIVTSREFPHDLRINFIGQIYIYFGLQENPKCLPAIRKKLWATYERSEEYKNQDCIISQQKNNASDIINEDENSNLQRSPVCVSLIHHS